MTPTGCSSSAGSSICNSCQGGDVRERSLEAGFNTPVLGELSCTMDVSKLLVALTAPLLNSTASTNGSRTSAGVSGDNNNGEKKGGGPTSGHNAVVDGVYEGATGSTGGRAEDHEKQQRQTATQPLCGLSCVVEETALVCADETLGTPSARGGNETERGSGKPGDALASVHEDPCVSTAGIAHDDGLASHGRTACGSNVEGAPGPDGTAVPAGMLSPQRRQDGEILVSVDNAAAPQTAENLRESCAEKQDETNCRTALNTCIESAGVDATPPGALHTAWCAGVQRCPSLDSAPTSEAAVAEKGQIADGETASAERKPGERVCSDVLSCDVPEPQNVPARICSTAAMEEGEHPRHTQQVVSERMQNNEQEAQEVEEQGETEQEHKQSHGQTGGTGDGAEFCGKPRAGDARKEGRCGVLATGVAQPGGGPGDAEDDAGERGEVSHAADKPGGDCAAPPAQQQEGQRLLEKLGQLQKAGCPSDDSTGSPSKRTSFEDAAEGAAGTEKQRNNAPSHQGTPQQRKFKELKQQLLQQFSPEDAVEVHVDEELKKSVTAVVAAAVQEMEANNGGVAYLPSRASHQASIECSTSCSLETAASSQSQSPLNVQKEAPEGGRRDSTNGCDTNATGFRSTRSAPNRTSEHSDSPLNIQHSSTSDETSISPANSSKSVSSAPSFADRNNAVHASTASENTSAAPRSHSACEDGNACDHSDTRSPSSAPWNSNACGGSGRSDQTSMSTSNNVSENSSTLVNSAYDPVSASDSIKAFGMSSTTDISSELSSKGAINSGVATNTPTQPKNTSVSSSNCHLPQDAGSRRGSAAEWTSGAVGAAVLEDCVHSVIDLGQNAARVLLLCPTEGGAAKQILLPSLLQKTTLRGERQLTECDVWGAKREKDELVGASRNGDEIALSAASPFGFYPSALGNAAAAGLRKDPAGPLLLHGVSDGNVERTTADAHACGLLQQELAANALSAGAGGILGTGTVIQGNLGTTGAAGTDTAAGMLEQSLSQLWMLQQRSNCLGASVSPAAPCSYQLPSGAPASFPWAPAGAASNLGAAPSVVRPPAATAVAAAALLPRSFRSRSDYLSLCSLQGCATTLENEREPRSLEELKQLPSEEHISLQEMHALAENLVLDFMMLHHSSVDFSTSSASSSRRGQRGSTQKTILQDDEGSGGLTGAAAATGAQGAEPLVLHYRRDNLSFSVTPASAFTPYPPSVFENTKKAHLRNSGASRAGPSVRNSMDEMEEEKKETLLGARFYTSPDFGLDGGSTPVSSERSAARRENASRGHSKYSAAEGASKQAAVASDADEFFPPQATTHFFKARCQQAGTEIGICDSTIGAVDRAFAEATTSFFRETQRQNELCGLRSDMTKQTVLDDQERKQQRNCSGGKAATEELCVDVGKGDMRAPSTRALGNVARGYQRLVPSGSGGADWRHERIY